MSNEIKWSVSGPADNTSGKHCQSFTHIGVGVSELVRSQNISVFDLDTVKVEIEQTQGIPKNSLKCGVALNGSFVKCTKTTAGKGDAIQFRHSDHGIESFMTCLDNCRGRSCNMCTLF